MNNILQWLDENSTSGSESPSDGVEAHIGRIRVQSLAFAAELCRMGVKKGDKVGLFFDNSSCYLSMLLAIWRLNAVVVPLAPKSLQQSRFARQASLIGSDCRVKWLIYTSATREDVLIEWMRLCDALAFSLDIFKNNAGPAFTRVAMDNVKCIKDDDIAVVKIPNNANMQARDSVLTHGMLLQQLNDSSADPHQPASALNAMVTANLLSLVSLPLAS